MRRSIKHDGAQRRNCAAQRVPLDPPVPETAPVHWPGELQSRGLVVWSISRPGATEVYCGHCGRKHGPDPFALDFAVLQRTGRASGTRSRSLVKWFYVRVRRQTSRHRRVQSNDLSLKNNLPFNQPLKHAPAKTAQES